MDETEWALSRYYIALTFSRRSSKWYQTTLAMMMQSSEIVCACLLNDHIALTDNNNTNLNADMKQMKVRHTL